MRNSSLAFALALVVGAALPACTLPDLDHDDCPQCSDPTDPTDPPEPTPPLPPQPHAAAVYHLTTQLAISAATVLPQPAYDAIGALDEFATSPGAAILDLAELAGVPAVDTLRDALPDVLESRLIGWIDDRLAGSPLSAVAAQVVALATTAVGTVELGSTLALADGLHTIDRVAVDVAGHRAELAVEAPAGGVLGLTADVAISTTATDLTLGEHRFGVRIGTAAWAALDAAIHDHLGADLQTALAAAIDCPGLALAIANKCVLGACVGHRTELEAVCTGAIDYAVAQLHDQVAGLDLDAVIFHAGHATPVDTDGDLVFDALTAGTWTAEVDAGVGPRPVPATFTGAGE